MIKLLFYNTCVIYYQSMNFRHIITIVLVFLLFSTLMCSVPLDFPPAYSQLIKSGSSQNQWWNVCKNVKIKLPQVQDNISAIHLTEENSTQLQSQKSQENISDNDQGQEYKPSISQIAHVVIEQFSKMVEEASSTIVQSLIHEQEDSQPVQYDDNFASLNGGAIILRKSSKKIHKAEAILQDNSEKYLYSYEKLPIQIIIALKQEVKVDRIRIRSNQIYSSIVKNFILEGAFAINHEQTEEDDEGKIWFKLLSAEAKNNRQQQQFRTKNKVVRFLKLTILSKHGDWKLFTMTQLKVYGSGLLTQALIDYQAVQNSYQPQLKENEILLASELSSIYKELYDFGGEDDKKPDENVLTFLFDKVTKLSKIHEFHIFYMHNMSKRLENVTKIEKQFRQHKNQYQAKNIFQEKYRQNKRLQQKISQMELIMKRQIDKSNKIIQQIKYKDSINEKDNVCPQKEDSNQTIIIIVAVLSTLFSTLITTSAICCCYIKLRSKESQNILRGKDNKS